MRRHKQRHISLGYKQLMIRRAEHYDSLRHMSNKRATDSYNKRLLGICVKLLRRRSRFAKVSRVSVVAHSVYCSVIDLPYRLCE